ncbi:hypothetical protein BY996DRAFT_7005406 [Phakopsora pachyrhizi]|nr:hypothetical protein BY996DRAFT_7005406 [Phakopsora pachyrhizi]
MSNNQKQKSVDRVNQIVQHFKIREPSKKLSRKVCILTGVGNQKGIGWATALLFAKEDVKQLYLIDLDGSSLPTLSSQIKNINPNTSVKEIVGDAADDKLIKLVCEQAIEDHGHLDVFFANAGISSLAPLNSTDHETVERTMKINAISTWIALKHSTESMLKNIEPFRGGSIIFTASVAGLRFGAGSTDYSASKAAVISLAQTGSNAYPGANIRVNTVCPGLIQTEMTDLIFKTAKDHSKIGQLCSLRRYGLPAEVAAVVLFLAGGDSSYINGAVIPVDGGLSSSLPVIPGKSF